LRARHGPSLPFQDDMNTSQVKSGVPPSVAANPVARSDELAAKVSDLVPREEYRQTRQGVFPSQASFDWHCRRHKKALVDAGALVFIAGRMLVHPHRMDVVAMEVARLDTIRRGGGL
jgi:hypothetical protein